MSATKLSDCVGTHEHLPCAICGYNTPATEAEICDECGRPKIGYHEHVIQKVSVAATEAGAQQHDAGTCVHADGSKCPALTNDSQQPAAEPTLESALESISMLAHGYHAFDNGPVMYSELCAVCGRGRIAKVHDAPPWTAPTTTTTPAAEHSPPTPLESLRVWLIVPAIDNETIDDMRKHVAWAIELHAEAVNEREELIAALKALDDYYQASGKVWDSARAVLERVGGERWKF